MLITYKFTDAVTESVHETNTFFSRYLWYFGNKNEQAKCFCVTMFGIYLVWGIS